jgi:hypothetical protein
LYFKNRINNRIQTIQTNEAGAFTIQLESVGIYDIYDKKDLIKAILSVDASATNFLGVRQSE